jgi:hypothetical protein
MAEVTRISDLLDDLNGLEGLSEHIEGTIRDEISELLTDQLKALVQALAEQGDTLSTADRQLQTRVKEQLAEAIPPDGDLEYVANAAADLVRNAVAKCEWPLRALTAWVNGRYAFEDPIVVDGQGAKS